MVWEKLFSNSTSVITGIGIVVLSVKVAAIVVLMCIFLLHRYSVVCCSIYIIGCKLLSLWLETKAASIGKRNSQEIWWLDHAGLRVFPSLAV